MHLSYEILKTKIKSLNTKPHDEPDFYRISKKQKIGVYNLDLDCLGCYVADKDGDYIFIDSRIRAPQRFEVQYHELTHAILDFPCDFLDFRQQLHAEIFALVFLIPKKMLFEFMQIGFDEIDYRLHSFVIRRKKIFDIFGL